MSFLEGEKVYLREVRLEDVNERYYVWMNDPDINQYMETRFQPQGKDYILQYVKFHKDKSDEPFFAICLKSNDEHVGNIKLGPIDYHHRVADISYFIGEKAYWGKGLATEAIKLVLGFGFRVLDLKKIKAGTYISNKGSRGVLRKNGFIVEEKLRKQVSTVGGQREDCLLWGILADEYNCQTN